MWRTRLIAAAIVTVLFAIGFAFLLAATFLALQQVLGATVAAAIVGGALVGAAGLVLLIVALMRPVPTPVAAAPTSLAPAASVAGQAGSLHAGIDIAQQLALVMRNLNPVTIGAVIAGVLYGMVRR